MYSRMEFSLHCTGIVHVENLTLVARLINFHLGRKGSRLSPPPPAKRYGSHPRPDLSIFRYFRGFTVMQSNYFQEMSRIEHLFLQTASKLLNRERRKTTHIKALFQRFRTGSIITCKLFWNPSRIDSDFKKFDWSKCFGVGGSEGWSLKPKWYSNQRVYCAGLSNHF